MPTVFLVINDSNGETAKFIMCTDCAALVPDPTENWDAFNLHQDWHSSMRRYSDDD